MWFVPSPFLDLLRDGKKYNYFGLHGCGIASAAVALAAVKEYVYDKQTVTPDRLLHALDTDYADDPELLHLLRYEAPKMGCDDDRADRLGTLILDAFADALEGKKNCLGGIWRAGTGTAMYYLWYSRDLGATADGRHAGEPFGTNFSPNLFTQVRLRPRSMRALGGSIGIRCRRRRSHKQPELFGSYLQLKQLAEVAVKTQNGFSQPLFL